MDTVLLLFNVGAPEIIVVALIVLLLFSGKKIPELMKGLGKGVRNFKEGMKDILFMQKMTFWDHFEDLRWIIFHCIGVVLILSIGFFIAMPWIFDAVVMAPCYGKFPVYKLFCIVSRYLTDSSSFCNENFRINIINIKLTSQFFIHMRTSFIFAFIISFPYIIFEIWRFIQPALYDKEKYSFRIAFTLSSVLFYSGLAVGYFWVFPLTLRFLAGYKISDLIVNQLSLDSYISTFVSMNLIMGIVFELPMLALIVKK